MKSYYLYTFFLLILILYSCQKNKSTTELITKISINPNEAIEELKLSEFIDSVKIIKLQTDSNCVIGRLIKIIIKENYIYALDASQGIVFVFDKLGNFVSKLDKQGKGPDEYLHLGPLFVDDNEQFVEIIDISGKEHKILKYSNIDFNLIENKRVLPNLSYNSCFYNAGFYYFATQQKKNIISKKGTNAGVLVVKDGILVKTLFDKNIKSGNNTYTVNAESFTINDEKELFVSIMYDNYFYKLVDGNAFPIFNVDFCGNGIDNSIGLKPVSEQLKYIESTKNVASFPVLSINNKNFMALSYLYKDEKMKTSLRQYIKFKNKFYHTKRIKNDITSFPSSIFFNTSSWGIPHEAWYNDYLVDIVLPSNEFLTGKAKKTIEGIGEIGINDNPIIVLMKIKK